MDMRQLADAVMAEADVRYDQGGWDVLAEAWTSKELESWWFECELEPTTVEEAIDSVMPMVEVWKDRQADARNSEF